MIRSLKLEKLCSGEGQCLTNVVFRRARKKDVPQIIAIDNTTNCLRMSDNTQGASAEELRFWVSDHRSIFLVAAVGSKIVGYAHGLCISPEWFFFNAFVILPSVQKCGIGKKMYAILREECRNLGIELIQGLVKEDQQKSLGYWVARGYKIGCTCIWVEDWINGY